MFCQSTFEIVGLADVATTGCVTNEDVDVVTQAPRQSAEGGEP